ncbi:MAG: hypothetical protein EB064_10090 [Betaproteobacteria bacterium]|nr:hypothetical protein [Betaproteobacteria bacterium]
MVLVIAEAQDDLAIKKDLDAALAPIKADLAVLKSEASQTKWMLSLAIGGIIVVLVKILSH